MIDKAAIEKNFSRFARHYDKYSAVQKRCARKLLGKIPSNNFYRILDIGCGTGNYTYLLRGKFPEAQIKAVDISDEMIAIAKNKLKDKNIEFTVADAESLDLRKKFDLISSNVSVQWFADLEKALKHYRRFLADSGCLLFSTFGPETFWELNKVLGDFYGRETKISAFYFLTKKDLKGALSGIFRKTEIQELKCRQSYGSLADLLER